MSEREGRSNACRVGEVFFFFFCVITLAAVSGTSLSSLRTSCAITFCVSLADIMSTAHLIGLRQAAALMGPKTNL